MYIRIWRSTYTKSTIKASRLSEFDKVLWLNFKTEFENYISQVFSLQTFVWSRSIWPANICLILTKNAGVWHKNLASGKIRRYDSSGLEPGIPTSGEVYPLPFTLGRWCFLWSDPCHSAQWPCLPGPVGIWVSQPGSSNTSCPVIFFHLQPVVQTESFPVEGWLAISNTKLGQEIAVSYPLWSLQCPP